MNLLIRVTSEKEAFKLNIAGTCATSKGSCGYWKVSKYLPWSCHNHLHATGNYNAY